MQCPALPLPLSMHRSLQMMLLLHHLECCFQPCSVLLLSHCFTLCCNGCTPISNKIGRASCREGVQMWLRALAGQRKRSNMPETYDQQELKSDVLWQYI